MTEKAKKQTAKTKPPGVVYAGEIPDEARKEFTAKLERISKGVAFKPGENPYLPDDPDFKPVVKLPKGGMAKTTVHLLSGLVSNKVQLAKFWEGLGPDQEGYIKTLFTKMRISVLRGDYRDVLPMLDDLIKIIEALKPKESLVEDAKGLRFVAEDLIGKLEAEIQNEERQDILAQSAEESGVGQQEEKPMESLKAEYQRSGGRTLSTVPSRAKKKAMSFWLPEDLALSIKDLATIRGTTIQDVLEEAMREIVARNTAPLEKFQAVMRELKKD